VLSFRDPLEGDAERVRTIWAARCGILAMVYVPGEEIAAARRAFT